MTAMPSPTRRSNAAVCTLAALALAPAALASPSAITLPAVSLTLSEPAQPAPAASTAPSNSDAAEPGATAPTPPDTASDTPHEFTLFGPSNRPYGSAGSKAWTVGGLYASDFEEDNDVNVHVAWSNFLADDFEFAVEVATWYFDQPAEPPAGSSTSTGDADTGGISGSMLFRWHALHADNYDWSLFFDAGIGLLAGFDEVPDGGTEFNFLPRLGGGFTTALGDNRDGQAPRLMLGARWHHISNARIKGDDRNPARDSLAGYVAIVFPF